MLQKIVDWLMSSMQPKVSQNLEEREEALKDKVKVLESKASYLEREAELRKKMVEANARIKAVTPQGRWLRWVVLGVGVLILFLMVKSCF